MTDREVDIALAKILGWDEIPATYDCFDGEWVLDDSAPPKLFDPESAAQLLAREYVKACSVKTPIRYTESRDAIHRDLRPLIEEGGLWPELFVVAYMPEGSPMMQDVSDDMSIEASVFRWAMRCPAAVLARACLKVLEGA